MNKSLAVLTLVLLTSGCSLFHSAVRPVEVEKRVQPIEILHPPLPDPLVWEKVEWKVLTVDQMREIIKLVDSGKLTERNAVFFAVTPEGYEHLSLNMAEIKRLIEGQKSVIMYYKTTVPDKIFLPKE